MKKNVLISKDLSQFLKEYGVIEDAATLNKLQVMLKSYLLRRKKSDETIIEVELTRVQKAYYRAFLSTFTKKRQNRRSSNDEKKEKKKKINKNQTRTGSHLYEQATLDKKSIRNNR